MGRGELLLLTKTHPLLSLKHSPLVMTWQGTITIVPVETGVIEYGTVTKDKRDTTTGSEYQEAVRPVSRATPPTPTLL